MKLFCFNLNSGFCLSGHRFAAQGEAPDAGVASDGAFTNFDTVGGAGDQNEEGPVVEELPPGSMPPAPPEKNAAAKPAAAGEAAGKAAEATQRLRVAVDSALEQGIARYQAEIDGLLAKEHLEKNQDILTKLVNFCTAHPVFTKGADKFSAWNRDFCQDVLGKNLDGRESRYAVYALQRSLNKKMLVINSTSSGYPLFTNKGTNNQTRIDGWMGGYTVSALAAYLNHVHGQKLAMTGLEGDTDTRHKSYQEAQRYLQDLYAGKKFPKRATGKKGPSAAEADEAEPKPAVPELAPEAYTAQLKAYMAYLKETYGDFIELSAINGLPVGETGKYFNIDSADFIAGFTRVAHYKLYHKPAPADWKEAIAGIPDLPQAELYAILPPALQRDWERAKIKQSASEHFRQPEILDAVEIVENFYESRHYANLANLERDKDVDDGLTLVRDFLEKRGYSNAEVRGIYHQYKQAIVKYDETRDPGVYEEIHGKMKNGERKPGILGRLKDALDRQKKQAIARVRYWASPGRLPKWMGNNMLLEQAREGILNRTINTGKGIFDGEIIPTWLKEVSMKDILGTLKDYNQDIAFGDTEALRLGCDWEKVTQLKRQFKFKVAKSPDDIAKQDRAIMDMVNSAIWFRNINKYFVERDARFLRTQGYKPQDFVAWHDSWNPLDDLENAVEIGMDTIHPAYGLIISPRAII